MFLLKIKKLYNRNKINKLFIVNDNIINNKDNIMNIEIFYIEGKKK